MWSIIFIFWATNDPRPSIAAVCQHRWVGWKRPKWGVTVGQILNFNLLNEEVFYRSGLLRGRGHTIVCHKHNRCNLKALMKQNVEWKSNVIQRRLSTCPMVWGKGSRWGDEGCYRTVVENVEKLVLGLLNRSSFTLKKVKSILPQLKKFHFGFCEVI